MSVSLHYLFKKTGDPIEFLNYHNDIFLDLLRALPKVKSIRASQVKADSFGGEPSYFLITQANFATKRELELALKSIENESVNKILSSFARGYVTILVSEELEYFETETKTQEIL